MALAFVKSGVDEHFEYSANTCGLYTLSRLKSGEFFTGFYSDDYARSLIVKHLGFHKNAEDAREACNKHHALLPEHDCKQRTDIAKQV